MPTFNEAANVEELSRRIAGALNGIPYEIVFVDDSTDETPLVLARLAREDERISFRHREASRGLGTAVVEGIKLAHADVIAVLDADLQHPPELLPVMYRELADADLVIPSRFTEGGDDGGLDPGRKLVSAVARYLGKFALRRLRGVSDPTSGYFMFRRAVIAGANLRPIGWKILLEVLVRGTYRRIVEIPYSFAQRHAGESKLRLTEHVNYVFHLAKLAATSPVDRRFYDTTLVGATGIFVNMALYVGLVHFAVAVPLAGTAAALTAMIWNFTLNDQLTWRRSDHVWTRAAKYVLTCIVGVAIAVAVLVSLYIGAHVAAAAANAIAILAAVTWNFTLNNLWTFKISDPEAALGFTIKHQLAG